MPRLTRFGASAHLTICKPVIRRNAEVGDWIVGTGSKQFGFENRVVYAMEVTQKMIMQEYEAHCKSKMPQKIPNWHGNSYKQRVGDCIYDFSIEPPKVLQSVHNEDNRNRDLGGKFALLSEHFYYFGDEPEPLPTHLLNIVRQGQGHKSSSNQPYLLDFVDWIRTQDKARNKVYSEPHDRHLFTLDGDFMGKCSVRHKVQDDLDEEAAND